MSKQVDSEVALRSFSFGPFVLIPERQQLLLRNAQVRIGGRALDILTALVERPGDVVSKRNLMMRAWPDVVVDEGNLKVNVAALRRLLETGGPEPLAYIATVTGRGYRFVAPVQAGGPPMSVSAPALTDKRRHNLPTGVTQIFGRADEINSIQSDLKEARLVSIVGPGGIGKTTVALAVAENAVGDFRDGVWLVDLALISDENLVPSAIAAAVGGRAHLPTPLAAVCQFLRGRETLLVLDSCEHLIEATATCVSQILAEAAEVKLLVTSREPLVVNGELVRRLRGLQTPPHSPLLTSEEALTFPAVQLFVDRATFRLESFRLSDADSSSVAEICRRLDGLALAIELAATRIDAFGVSGLLKQLDDRFRLLVGRRAGPERHRTLAATIDWSYSLLLPIEAALLRAVSVFAGVFDIDGAAAVSTLPRATAAEGLAHLAAKSLLTIDLDAGGIAYRLLETTRSDCSERLWRSGEDLAVRQRHAEHICAVLECATAQWAHRSAREWAVDYGRYLDDLRDALAWTATDPLNQSLRIRLTLAGILVWNHFSLTGECRTHVSKALDDFDSAGLAGTEFEMKLKLWLGGSTMLTREFGPQALGAMKQALTIAVQIGDTDYHLRCLSAISLYELWTGDHEAALHTLDKFRTVAAANDPTALPEGEVNTAIAELFLGRLESSKSRLESLRGHDLRYFSGSYGVRYLADTQILLESVLSHIQWLMGFPDTAARTSTAAIERARAVQHHLSLNNAFSYACAIPYWSGQYDLSGRYASMLEEHVQQHELVARRPVAMFYRAASAHAGGDSPDVAVQAITEAVEAFRSINYLTRMPYYLSVLSEALVRAGRLADAQSTIARAGEMARAQGEGWCLPEVLRIHALVCTAHGKTREAEELLHESLTLSQSTRALSWQLRSANDLASIWIVQSKSADARQLLLPIHEKFTEGFATRDLLRAANLLSSLS